MKPTEYHLELCDTAGAHGPIAILRSATPFMAVAVGERFDDEGWPRSYDDGIPASPEAPRRYLVHSIKHVVVDQPDKLIVRYCLNLTPFTGDRSPVWGQSPPIRQQ